VAIPLAARIHEGLVFSNRDRSTQLDKMITLLGETGLGIPFYFVADAYYASRKVILPLLADGNHLLTRVRINAVGYLPAPVLEVRRRGRPRKYGERVEVKSLFDDPETMDLAASPVYGESDVTLRVRSVDLLWPSVGVLLRFVAVVHPTRGRCILMCTDLELTPIEIIRLYGCRFKIDLARKVFWERADVLFCMACGSFSVWSPPVFLQYWGNSPFGEKTVRFQARSHFPAPFGAGAMLSRTTVSPEPSGRCGKGLRVLLPLP
jgi:hypothetical protein